MAKRKRPVPLASSKDVRIRAKNEERDGSEEILAGNVCRKKPCTRSFRSMIRCSGETFSGDDNSKTLNTTSEMDKTIACPDKDEGGVVDPSTPVFPRVKSEKSCDFSQNDTSQPAETVDWTYKNIDICDKIEEIRRHLSVHKVCKFTEPVPDKNKARNLRRQMSFMKFVIDTAYKYQLDSIENLKNRCAWSNADYERIKKKKSELEKEVDLMRERVIALNCNITESTQTPVLTLLNLRAEELQLELLDEEDDSVYDNSRAISQLCNVALDSLRDLYNLAKKMKEDLTSERKRLKDVEKELAEVASRDALSGKLAELSIEQLRELASHL